MTKRFFYLIMPALLMAALAAAQQGGSAAAAKVSRLADGHPDLSGIWSYAIELPPTALKKQVNGKVIVNTLDQSARRSAQTPIPGALASTPKPSYKPEFLERVKYLSDNESKVDKVFYCGKP